MTVLYAESSAVLAWLLGEPRQKAVLGLLSAADRVVSSILTVVECSRALARARAASRVSHAEELAALRLLDEAAATWSLLDVSDRVAVRACGSFPVEPIRTLDALHLATAIVFGEAVGKIQVLSLDDRVRHNAGALGLAVVPA
ncbi:MAG TPA: type II toxin-antitoxin system VapC family toxin [Gemmatimonadales bacterium]|nr:type II toxin-antitoxin system VapC family toxin [Gemmatimonadales bacterium]